MPVQNAINFISRGLEDNSLRDRLNTSDTCEERDEILSGEHLLFSGAEFDEAYHFRLTQCQEQEDAEHLKEFKLWWDLLSDILQPKDCGGACLGFSH